MSRRALIVGVSTYAREDGRLHAPVRDAQSMANVLARNKDGTQNFECVVWLDRTIDGSSITRSSFRLAVQDLFASEGDVLLYFSGHGYLDLTGGLLCTSDAIPGDWGVSMQEVVDLAITSPARNILVMLDCCFSGGLGNPAVLNKGGGKNPLATIRENMTVISASRSTELAFEAGGLSLFTAALLDALEGGAADHMGLVTAPALYVYVSRRFVEPQQRPTYKTSATDVLVVRQCEPLIDRLQLQQLPVLFPTLDHKYALDPEFEPEDEFGNMKEPVNREKVAIAQLLKAYRDAGLIRPSDPKLQLYWVARSGGTVELSLRGREHWWLVVNDIIPRSR